MGDIESAYHILEAARDALKDGDTSYARDAVAEALDLLRTDDSSKSQRTVTRSRMRFVC